MLWRLPPRQGIGLNEERNIKKEDVASYKALSLTSSVRKDEVGSARAFTQRPLRLTLRRIPEINASGIFVLSEVLASRFSDRV